MSEFGLYAFNSSHSYSYAYLSYYTAFLKANYPTEFYCACISCETDIEAQSIYVNDAKRHGIDILPPVLNSSELDFSIADGKILYGFKGIKGIGDKAIEAILSNRPYSSATSFFRSIVDNKLKIPKQVIEALIKIGAFDCYGVNRRILLDTFDKFTVDYKAYLKKPASNLPIHFSEDAAAFYGSAELSLFDILSYEKKYMGIYLSGNPFDFAKKVIGSSTSIYENIKDPGSHSVFCEILSIKETKTKSKGEKMGIYKCIDSTNCIFEFPLFPEMYKKYSDGLSDGSFIIVNFKNAGRGPICVSVKNVNSLIDDYTKTLNTENSIRGLSLRFDDIVQFRKFLTRQEKSYQGDPELLRPCNIFFKINGYNFALGKTTYNTSNEFMRFLNQIEGIQIKINRDS